MNAIKNKPAPLILEIDLDIRTKRWDVLPFDLAALLEHFCRETMKKGLPAELDLPDFLEISAVFTDDADIQTMNADYRNKDKPTNVLSFPQQDDIRLAGSDYILIPPLGDLVFAYETIKREAEGQEKSFRDHLAHLIVHGTLHLLGYDHIDEEQAEEMENLEIEILAQNDINNPYLAE